MTIRQILLVEDNPGDARLVREYLDPSRFGLTHVVRLDDAKQSLRESAVDLILLDLTLPDSTQADTTGWMTHVAPQVPIIVLTGRHDEELAATLVRAGVQDYLEKDRLDGDILARTIRHAIERGHLLAQVDDLRRRQLEARDQLLGHVSHELRTPLNAVFQFLSLIEDGTAGPLNAEQSDYLGVALRNVAQLRRMISDLLDATRVDASTVKVELQRTALGPVLLEAVRSIEPTIADRGLSLDLTVPDDLPAVLADAARVQQIVLNLLDNASKFTPRGGRVALAAAHEGEHVVVRVSDTGCGIPEADHERVFERLYQVGNEGDTARHGLGLGLHLCREFTRRMNGHIGVERHEGPGSRIAFTLPLARLHS